MKSGRNFFTRRAFLLSGLAGLGGVYLYRRQTAPPTIPPGTDYSPSYRFGHRLRTGDLPALPLETPGKSVDVLILGGGIAGLSAAWWLQRAGLSHYRLMELEPEVGGNSKSSTNAIGPYPWGAHYVPLPNQESHLVRLLFEELGIITGYRNGEPLFEERYLCADPAERLYYEGTWNEGLLPSHRLSTAEKEELTRFFEVMAAFRQQRGRDGKRAFAIPLDLSSQDAELLALDRLSFGQWLTAQGFQTPMLRWYADYSCRDDYGLPADRISAWAGIHYFASRQARSGNSDPHTVITWPEGNGWLVNRLRAQAGDRITTGQMAYAVRPHQGKVAVDLLETATGQPRRLWAKAVIVALPHFIASRLVKGASDGMPTYAPWLVANVSLSRLPASHGAALSWDNVSFYSKSLGYIVSTHQAIHPFPTRTVLTYYRPLVETSHDDIASTRRKAYETSASQYRQLVQADLEKMHPGIGSQILTIDTCVWGHGMVSPVPGYLWGGDRKKLAAAPGPVQLAHSDLSGISIFEEAQYQGVQAAERVLKLFPGRKA